MADMRDDPEFQARLREYSRQMRQSTPNMWISPNGIVHEVDNHLDFVAQTRFGADNSEDYADKTGDPDVYNTLSEEAETMLEAGWIRVVGHSGGLGGFANDIGIQGTLDSLIDNQRVLDREVIAYTDANELIVEIVHPGERGNQTFYVKMEDARREGLIKATMRRRIAEGVLLSDLRRRVGRDVHVRGHRRRA